MTGRIETPDRTISVNKSR